MPSSGDVAVVIPARNEAERIRVTVAGATGLPGVDLVIVVDDGSADDTAVLAGQAAGTGSCLRDRGHPRVCAIPRPVW